jgi:hypothetical protein
MNAHTLLRQSPLSLFPTVTEKEKAYIFDNNVSECESMGGTTDPKRKNKKKLSCHQSIFGTTQNETNIKRRDSRDRRTRLPKVAKEGETLHRFGAREGGKKISLRREFPSSTCTLFPFLLKEGGECNVYGKGSTNHRHFERPKVTHLWDICSG